MCSLLYKTVGYNFTVDENSMRFPYYGVPSVIAVNMILAGASGGIVAVVIATWAQVGFLYGYYSYCCVVFVRSLV